MGKFLAGPLGSALRVAAGFALGELVAYLGNGGTFRGLSWAAVELWLGGAVAVGLPLVIAALNPADTRFGRGA